MRNLFAGLMGVCLLLAGCGGGGSTVTAGSGTGNGTQVSVPNVANDTQAAATSTLMGVGLALGTITSQVSTTVASGLVISETPVANTSVAQGTMVNLVLSSGSGTGTQVSVPNVANDTQAAATSALTGAGLAVGTITSQLSTTVASGLVISETPAAGTSVAQGTMVNLVLSSGGIAVPNVVGNAQSAATSAITGAGLTVGAVTSQASNTVASGNVISENPVAGTGVVSGTSVALVVSSGATTTAYNVVNAIVDQGPSALATAGVAAVNIMYVKVTVCAPGSTTNCQTIDHVQVDTGSQGLRILDSVITNAALRAALPAVAVGGGSLAECTQFVDGYSWGPLVTADVHVGGSDTATTGESAPGIPIQVIGTAAYAVPTACSNVGGTEEDTVVQFGANGIIGLGLFEEDCGTSCSQTASNGLYYSCTTGGGCTQAVAPIADQMVNPVFKLVANNGVTDNNGVVIVLPAVGAAGAANVPGTLVFGIGTQSNNALPSTVTVLTTDPLQGLVTTTFLAQTDTNSYLDSGSNALYFDDSSIPNCTQTDVKGFFCPTSTEAFMATITGTNAQAATINFSIADAFALFSTNQTLSAFSNLGGTAGSSGSVTFAWGLPFYYGRNVYTAMEHTSPGGTPGPYFAF